MQDDDTVDSSTDEAPAPSWAPLDLAPFLDGTHIPVEPSLLTRTDGVSLFYSGLTHSLHGESETCKSMVAQYGAARVLTSGGRVLYLDFESEPAEVVERLRLLGAEPDAIRDRFRYVKPETKPDTAHELGAWTELMAQPYDLAVIDGVTDSLAVFGLSTIDNDDLTKWAMWLPRQVARRTGATVVQIDHVTKNTETRGRFAIGGQAKLNGLTGAAYVVEVAETVGRGLRGVVVLRVAKDRPGYVRARSGKRRPDGTQETARVVFDSTGDDGLIDVNVEPWSAAGGAATTAFRPTSLMQSASEVLEVAAGALSFRNIDKRLKGKQEYKTRALDVLVAEGYVARVDGPNQSHLHTSVRPYRQHDDPRSDEYRPVLGVRDALDGG